MRDIMAKGCGPTFSCSDGALYKVTTYISTIDGDRPGEVRLMVYRIGYGQITRRRERIAAAHNGEPGVVWR